MTKIKKISLVALFTALIIIGGFIKIPLPYVPITLQYIFTALAGLLLGPFLGLCSVLVYIFMGLVGLPVFASGGGFSYVVFPTFGYLIGFCFGAVISGGVANLNSTHKFTRFLIGNLIALFVIYFFGVLYFYLIKNFYMATPIAFSVVLINCCLLFIPTDLCFAVLASVIAKQVRPILLKQNLIKYNYNTKFNMLFNKNKV